MKFQIVVGLDRIVLAAYGPDIGSMHDVVQTRKYGDQLCGSIQANEGVAMDKGYAGIANDEPFNLVGIWEVMKKGNLSAADIRRNRKFVIL
jgi:hypothetical protein